MIVSRRLRSSPKWFLRRGNYFVRNTLKKSLHAAARSWRPIRGDLVACASGVVTFATASSAVRLSDPRPTILAAGREVQLRHHIYRDLPLTDLIAGLDAGAKHRALAANQRQGRGLSTERGLPANDRSIAPLPRSTTCSTAIASCR
jgi:hypothetical protein